MTHSVGSKVVIATIHGGCLGDLNGTEGVVTHVERDGFTIIRTTRLIHFGEVVANREGGEYHMWQRDLRAAGE